MKKLDYIDALRGLAILGVIMIHTDEFGSSNIPGITGKIIREGATGVQLFYLISAFTLFRSFKNRVTNENHPIRNFFLRRFFRIAPMYYLGICYYLFQNGLGPRYWLGDQTHITFLNIFSNFIFVHGFNPYWINSIVPGGWSIGIEMIFYAVLPFLFLKIKSLNQAFTFFIMSLFLKMLVYLLFINFHLISDNRLWSDYLYFYFPNQLPVFSLGIILYFIIAEKQSIKTVSGKSLFLFAILILVQLATGTHFILSNHILFGIGFFLLALSLSIFRFKFIVNPIIEYIGKISFSMYIVHAAILHWLTYFNLNSFFDNGIFNYVTRFFIVSVLTIIISSIFYYIIELPCQDIGKKIITRLEVNRNRIPRIPS